MLAATADGSDLDRTSGRYKDMVVVGFDSGVDSETAKNASLPCVLCDWGYWDRDRLENCAALGIISAPAELLQYV